MRGITIILNGESVHTGNDLDLVQEVKEIEKPEIQSHIVEIPGRNGTLNLTKSLTGKVNYYNRDMKFRYFGTGSRQRLLELDAIMSQYHGETVQIIDDDYPDHYYEGEVSVSSEFESNYIRITLTVDAQPFRLKRWRSGGGAFVDEEGELIVENESIDAIPVITVSGEISVTFNGATVILSDGTYEDARFTLHKGENIFLLSGRGTIDLTYQEGAI